MNRTHMVPRLRRAVSRRLGAAGTAALLLTTHWAGAQVNQSNADAAYNAYNAAFLVQSGGQTYYKKGSGTSSSDNAYQGTWGGALDIGLAQDVYERVGTASAQTMVNNLVTTFLAQNNFDWSTNSWNDDIGWMTICCMRGYEITGNAAFLTKAKSAWAMAYNRGWDNTFGGGIWENMATLKSKCALSCDSLGISGCELYQATGDSTYLTKCQAIYSWVRANLFNASTGQVNEGWTASGLESSDNVYNSGAFINFANRLHNLTGQAGYYNDALLAADHVVNKWAIIGNTQRGSTCWQLEFVRGLKYFCRDNNLWSRYYTWLMNNANAAWNERRTDLNLTWNSWTSQTPSDDCSSMECLSAAVVQQVIPAVYELDALTVQAYAGPGYRVISDSNFLDGQGVILDSTAVGNYISFLVPEIAAGKYDVHVSVKKLNSRGIFQTAIGQVGNNSPVNMGATQDLYTSGASYPDLDLGTWAPATSSDKWFWFKVTGKNAASSNYSLCFDTITLYPVK